MLQKDTSDVNREESESGKVAFVRKNRDKRKSVERKNEDPWYGFPWEHFCLVLFLGASLLHSAQAIRLLSISMALGLALPLGRMRSLY